MVPRGPAAGNVATSGRSSRLADFSQLTKQIDLVQYADIVPRELLGEVEHLVLLALLRLNAPAYGVPILDEIETRTGRTPSRAAVYVALQRLEAKGLLTSRLGEPSAERGGRARRYFQLEAAGLAALRDSRQALVSMWKNVEHRLDPKPKAR